MGRGEGASNELTMGPQNERMELTALRGGRAGNGVMNAAASRSPFGERRRRSSSAVFDGHHAVRQAGC